MNTLHVKTGDTVMLISGDKKDRGKTGKVLEVSPKEKKVIVEGLNKVKKHVKPRKAGDPSGIIEIEGHACLPEVQQADPHRAQGLRRREKRPPVQEMQRDLLSEEDMTDGKA